jgi:uncharacterized C2H2 Zn-finger protein
MAKQFNCEICDYFTSRKGDLVRHINMKHKKLKRYGCDLCDFLSFHYYEFLEHSKTVHLLNKNIFKCDNCDMAYSLKKNLVRHINMKHKNLKRFGCDLCDFTSFHYYELQKVNNNLLIIRVCLKNFFFSSLKCFSILFYAQPESWCLIDM